MIPFAFDFPKEIRYKCGNRDKCSQFSVIFEIKSKFVIALVRLILPKVVVDGFTGLGQKIDVRYEFDFKVVLKGLLCK